MGSIVWQAQFYFTFVYILWRRGFRDRDYIS
ncbi:hypothetical protein BC792_10234 [Sphingobacterium allocomposti]|jgi:hypothetical protein|uniref:Uncharacterized protein n=1 Tax=Sphingobacterium allocomposti TaxID=415956 RepID=A0A5S5DNU3_9SPHI|nr:hypothetical protein BC792_10234 [Sphingobacterium composti Yoo et al. 2007 non Ten et al. 2007]